MEKGDERKTMFSEEEAREISGLQSAGGGDSVEVTCGCTSRRYGDAVGRLRVYSSGDLVIQCDCVPGCPEGWVADVASIGELRSQA